MLSRLTSVELNSCLCMHMAVHVLRATAVTYQFTEEYPVSRKSGFRGHTPTCKFHVAPHLELHVHSLQSSGGGNQINLNLDVTAVPLQWMAYESVSHGLQIPLSGEIAWSREKLHLKESLTHRWKLLEYLPIKRLTYRDRDTTTSR
jgi:hypothetical protein